MDYQYYQNNQPSSFTHKRSAGMETAALFLGILSVLTCACLYLSLIFGALAILLGLLSRGGSMKMGGKAVTGVVTGAIGLVFTAVLYTLVFSMIFRAYGGAANFCNSYLSIITDEDYTNIDDLYQALYDDLEEHLSTPDSDPPSSEPAEPENSLTDTESVPTDSTGEKPLPKFRR